MHGCADWPGSILVAKANYFQFKQGMGFKCAALLAIFKHNLLMEAHFKIFLPMSTLRKFIKEKKPSHIRKTGNKEKNKR